MHALSNIKMVGQDIKILEYSPVVKIPESEGLLVCHCSASLAEYGLTLWVVSILMYDQEFYHKKLSFSLFFVSCHMAANKVHIVSSRHLQVPKYHFCTNRNIMLCTPKNFNFFYKFQCKHSHDYSDVLFHVFTDHLMPSPSRADPEQRMREALMHFIKENKDQVNTIAAPFLKKKKLSLDEYIQFMSTPSHRGDELTIHILAIMHQKHYCIVMKSNIYYSHPNTFPSLSAVHTELVYLGNSIFQDTMTLTKKMSHLHPILTSMNHFQVT